ncbi:MAG: DUF4304 domain-containing protein [Ignavibacteria bacterium]|nr:DUF4304 domain-containing protein [Ignavibacteria bacterium]
MISLEFKSTFNEVAKEHKFEKAHGGWFLESPECMVVLDLQKSNYDDYYYLNVKVFVQGMFGNTYARCKDLVKKDVGDVFMRHPDEYSDIFNFSKFMDDDRRKQGLEELFREFVNPLTEKALSREGLKELGARGTIYLLPAVKAEL